jgi:Protein of unknown function (DUF3152)
MPKQSGGQLAPKHIKYWTSVSNGLPNGQQLAQQFAQIVASILQDGRGWVKFGYTFEDIGPIVVKEDKNAAKGALEITLRPKSEIKSYCGSSLGDLSCYVPFYHKININYDNWMGKSRSSLPIDRYRIYAINHEVGHALGYDHPAFNDMGPSDKKKYITPQLAEVYKQYGLLWPITKSNGHVQVIDGAYCLPGSVMIQMSKGPLWAAPFEENEWPLPVESHFQADDWSDKGQNGPKWPKLGGFGGLYRPPWAIDGPYRPYWPLIAAIVVLLLVIVWKNESIKAIVNKYGFNRPLYWR